MIKKIIIVATTIIILGSILFPAHNALAVISVFWQGTFPGSGVSYTTNDGGVNSGTIVEVNVTDTSFAGNSVIDHISVLVNSTSDPTGIPLTLTEDAGDTGKFGNTNLIFTDGSGLHSQSSSQTVGIDQPSSNLDSNSIETVIGNSTSGILVFSSSDSVTGIFLNSTETGKNTGVFTSPLKFTNGPSVNGSSIQVKGGDIVSILNVFTFNFENELVTPNPDPGLGALPAISGDVLSIIYNGVKDDASITSGFGPGGGGGGLIRPSLVLDIVGGSHFIISPPSFGGGYFHFPDGLSIIQGISKTIHDISHYNQDIPLQVLVKDKPVNMTFKTFQSYNPNGLVHMGLFLIPPKTDMIIPNSIASISWDRNVPMELNDPEHILANASVSITSDGVFQYTHFSFIPTKSYDQMSFLARAWNDHHYSRDVRIYDDPVENTSMTSVTLPPGTTKYENYDDLLSALEKDGFHKPSVMSHIHDSSSVFGSSQAGQVFWLYDTKNQTVTLVISDKDGNEVGKTESSLDPITSEKKGDYKFMHFTTKQLNRWNEDDMKRAMGIEASKAMFSALENGIMPYRNWSSGN